LCENYLTKVYINNIIFARKNEKKFNDRL